VASPSPAASTPDQRDRVVVERGEHADRVRAAADAGDDAVGQPAGAALSSSRASSPMSRCRSRTIAGYGAGPTAEPST
jgi:hypothetical protein